MENLDPALLEVVGVRDASAVRTYVQQLQQHSMIEKWDQLKKNLPAAAAA